MLGNNVGIDETTCQEGLEIMPTTYEPEVTVKEEPEFKPLYTANQVTDPEKIESDLMVNFSVISSIQ